MLLKKITNMKRIDNNYPNESFYLVVTSFVLVKDLVDSFFFLFDQDKNYYCHQDNNKYRIKYLTNIFGNTDHIYYISYEKISKFPLLHYTEIE